MPLGLDVLEQELRHCRHSFQCLIEGGGAAAFGEHHPGPGPRERSGDSVGREVRLDRQICASGLEDADDSGHPLQVPFGDDCHDVLRPQTAREQSAGYPVGAGVQLRVRPLPRVLDGRDLFGTLPDALLEQLVEAPLGPGPLGPGELLQLEAPLLRVDEVGVGGIRLGVR